MGDRSPDVRTIGKLTSKFLTPCRTFGLKRRRTPNSDSLKKVRTEKIPSFLHNDSSNSIPAAKSIIISTPSFSPSKSHGQDSDSTKYQDYIMSSSLCRPRNTESSLIKSSKPVIIEYNMTPKKSRADVCLFPRKNSCPTPSSLDVVKSEDRSSPAVISDEHSILESQISARIKRIHEKVGRVEKLKQEAVYTRKHNLLELQKSSDKWLSALKEITSALHSELQERGRQCTLLDILIDHNIPPDRVGFNEDSQEFD